MKYSATASHTARQVTPVTKASSGTKCSAMNGIDERLLMCSFGAQVEGSRVALGATGNSTPAGFPASTTTDMHAPVADDFDRRWFGRRSTAVQSTGEGPVARA